MMCDAQIPKAIGRARLHGINGRADYAIASNTFWTAVTRHHGDVIGGNGDREYFTATDSPAGHVTEQTCETCASYNMLKLTRQIYARAPHASCSISTNPPISIISWRNRNRAPACSPT